MVSTELSTPCAYVPRAREDFRPFVYGLVDPAEPKHVRYVGMAMQSRRPYQHAINARKSAEHSHLFHWIRLLQSKGREPAVLILEELSRCSSRHFVGLIECMYIDSLRKIGHNLVNVAKGGFGGATRNGMSNSENQKAIVSARRGWHHTAEVRALLSEAKKGKPGHVQTPQEIEKRRQSLLSSPAHKEAMKSEARSEAIAAGQRGRKHSAEEIANCNAGRAAAVVRKRTETGRYRTVESCAQASVSIKAALAKRTPEQKLEALAKLRATLAAKKAGMK